VRPTTTYLKATLRALAKELVWLACEHEPGGQRDIALFATRRGASTWVMEVIAANRGIRPLNQPFELQSRTITLAQALEVPKFDKAVITSLDAIDERRMRGLMTAILEGRIIVGAPVKPWAPTFDRRSNRLVLKILDAKAVIGWFADTFPLDVVYLTRHPIPQALSCIRNGWTLTTRPYLEDVDFVTTHLGEEHLGWCTDLLRDGDDLDRFVLNWGLENLAPLRQLPARPEWTHVRYEDCVRRPEAVIDRLADALGLADRDRMLAQVERPSQSSTMSTAATRTAIAAGDRGAVAEGWRARVDADTERRVLGHLDRLGIDLDLVVDGA
jgi:hypothetical protein